MNIKINVSPLLDRKMLNPVLKIKERELPCIISNSCDSWLPSHVPHLSIPPSIQELAMNRPCFPGTLLLIGVIKMKRVRYELSKSVQSQF